jgi:hypothetical protein
VEEGRAPESLGGRWSGGWEGGDGERWRRHSRVGGRMRLEQYLGPNFGLPHGLELKTVRGKCKSRAIFSSKYCRVRGACLGHWI